MRKIIFILSLFISVIGYSQTTTTTQYLGSPSTKVINRGVLRTDSSFQNAIRDTNFIPDRIGIQVMRPQDSSVYVSISTVADSKWAKIGGGSYVNLADSNTVYTTPTWVTNAIAAIVETDPDFDANGVKLTGNQTIAGFKTFSSGTYNTNNAGFTVIGTGSANRSQIGKDGTTEDGFLFLGDGVGGGGFGGFLVPGDPTGNWTWTMPDSTGTIPIAIYVNGTRYNANSRGTIDIGTISGGSGSGLNIYNSDSTLSANRTVDGASNTRGLSFIDLNYFQVQRNGNDRIYMNNLATRINSPDETQSVIVQDDSTLIDADNLNMIFKNDSARINKKISYTTNLGSTFSIRSLVDKGYVDSASTSPADFLPLDLISATGSGPELYVDTTGAADTIKVRTDTGGSGSTDSLLTGSFTVAASGDTIYPNNGDSLLISPDFVGNHVLLVTKDTTYLPNRSTFGYTISNDTLKFNPALQTGQKVEIKVWKGAQRSMSFTAQGGGGGGGGSATAINFVGSNLNNSSGEWTKTGGGGWEGMGVGESLGAGVSGYIQATRTDASSHTAFIGFEGDNTVETFSGFGAGPAAIYWNSSGQVGKMDGGGFGAAGSIGVTLAIGETAGIFRDGGTGVYTLKISTDGGSTWGSVVYTFTGTQFLEIWAKCSIDTGGTLSQPKKSY